jgi:hypothetical protein
MKEEGAQGGSGEGQDHAGEKIVIEGKEYSHDDVKSILENAKATTAKASEVAKIIDAAKSYDLSPEEFVEQSTGAFSVISSLIEAKVIDSNGRLLPKQTQEPEQKSDLSKVINKDKGLDLKGTDPKILEVIQALSTQVKGLSEKLESTEATQTSLIRQKFSGEIKASYPNLDDDDISRVFANAMQLKNQGKKVELLGVAKLTSDAKQLKQVQLEKDFALRHGLNYDELVKQKNENLLNEKSNEPASAVILKGRKISFNPGKDTVSPKAATRELFSKLFKK